MLSWLNSNIHKKTQITEQIKQQSNEQNQLLPGLLASNILDLQFICEGQQTSQQLIAQLASLYTEAIQYYEAAGNKKYMIYKKRMDQFLNKPTIDQILRGKSGQLVNRRESAEKCINYARIKSKSQVNRLIDQTQKKGHRIKLIVQKNLQHQASNLEARIQKRKTMSNRSTNSIDQDENEETKKTPVKTMNNELLLLGILGRTDQKIKRVFI